MMDFNFLDKKLFHSKLGINYFLAFCVFNVLNLFVLISYVNYFNSKILIPNLALKSLSYASPRNGVNITLLSPLDSKCLGRFYWELADGSVFEVIEATLDTRPILRRNFRLKRPSVRSFIHVRIYVAFEYGFKLSAESAVIPNNYDLESKVDHILQLICNVRKGENRKRDTPICVYAIVVSIWPKQENWTRKHFNAAVFTLLNENRILKLPIAMNHTTDEKFSNELELNIPSSCISGKELLDPSGPLKFLQDIDYDCSKSSESVLALGSPISGDKKDNEGAREAAHFAYRSLSGKVVFHTVVIALQERFTRSNIFLKCKEDIVCQNNMIDENWKELQSASKVINAELKILNLDPKLSHRILVTTFCRLGSVGELGSCSRLRARGQVPWGDFIISEFSASHKWFGSMDLDEMLAPDPRKGHPYFRPQVSSTVLLDSVNKVLGEKDAVKFYWLPIFPHSYRDMFGITSTLHNSKSITIDTIDTGEDFNGKSFSKCKSIVGLTVHNPVVNTEDEEIDIIDYTRMINGFRHHPDNKKHFARKHNTNMFVWHMRLPKIDSSQPKRRSSFKVSRAFNYEH